MTTIAEGFLLTYTNESFWRYDEAERYWKPWSDRVMKQNIQENLRGKYETAYDDEGNAEVRPIKLKPKNVNDLLEVLKNATHEVHEPLTGGVPFRNAWLDVHTGEVVKSSAKRFNTWCVPADHDPEAACPQWLAFLESLGWGADTDEHRLLRQWFGYLLSGDNHRQRMLLLHGPTRAGKGVIEAIVYRLMGDGAVGVQLESLAGEFGLQAMLGKSVGLVGDARFNARVDKRIVERLLSVSGRDPLQVNIKNKAQVTTRLGTRLMMATNERPVFTDSSEALARRFLILHMDRSFLGREDLHLEERLASELPGIVLWALDGYRDLEAQGDFTVTAKGAEMQEDFVRDSAPLRHFVDEMCVIELDAKVTNHDLYTAYSLWCQANGMFALNSVHFMRELLTAYEGQIVEYKSGSSKGKRGLRLA